MRFSSAFAQLDRCVIGGAPEERRQATALHHLGVIVFLVVQQRPLVRLRRHDHPRAGDDARGRRLHAGGQDLAHTLFKRYVVSHLVVVDEDET